MENTTNETALASLRYLLEETERQIATLRRDVECEAVRFSGQFAAMSESMRDGAQVYNFGVSAGAVADVFTTIARLRDAEDRARVLRIKIVKLLPATAPASR